MAINYKVGDVVEQHPFGMAEMKRVVGVKKKSANIKNGRPGFEGALIDLKGTTTGASVWGYDDEIQRILFAGGQ